eukprot:COSAG01_NODE_1924_length_8886_cov_6.780699_9_plen_88_part_00
MVLLHAGDTVPFGYCGPIQQAVFTETGPGVRGGAGGGGVHERTSPDVHSAPSLRGPAASRKKHLSSLVLTVQTTHCSLAMHWEQHSA